MIMEAKCFGIHWKRWAICSVNFSIIINGQPRRKLQATKGIRQDTLFRPFSLLRLLIVLAIFCHLQQQITTLGYSMWAEKGCR